MKDNRALSVAAMLLAAIACVAFLARRGDSVDSLDVGGTTPVSARQLGAFSILRTDPDPPPPSQARAMKRVVAGFGFGVRIPDARPVATQVGEMAWVVPGRRFICVMASHPVVAGCNTTDATIAQGMSVVAITPAPLGRNGKLYTLFGIAPDGVRKVAIRQKGKPPINVPVIRNVYSYRAPTMLYASLRR